MLVELGLMEQRYKAVLEVLDGAVSVTDVARRYGVGRQTVHTWLRRYATEGLGCRGWPTAVPVPTPVRTRWCRPLRSESWSAPAVPWLGAARDPQPARPRRRHAAAVTLRNLPCPRPTPAHRPEGPLSTLGPMSWRYRGSVLSSGYRGFTH